MCDFVIDFIIAPMFAQVNGAPQGDRSAVGKEV
jgi:hypothetical protein